MVVPGGLSGHGESGKAIIEYARESGVEKTSTDPTSHIDSLPDPIREAFRKLDELITDVMAGASRTLWVGKFWGGTDQRIIGYGGSTGRDVEWFRVGLAGQKDHLSVYVNAVDDDGYLVKRYADRLGKVRVGSAVVNFKRLEDLDLDVFREVDAARSQLG